MLKRTVASLPGSITCSGGATRIHDVAEYGPPSATPSNCGAPFFERSQSVAMARTDSIAVYGKKRWRDEVAEVVEQFVAALEPDYVVLGGGNAKLLKELPANARLGANENAFLGGFRLWDPGRSSLAS